ncbi:MAG: ChaN family lipoprotein [Pseudomonadota bacterium]
MGDQFVGTRFSVKPRWWLMAALVGLSSPAAAETAACPSVGTWLDPKTGQILAADRMIADLAERRIVLLGESHDNPEHHRWQLHTLAALQSRRPELVIGFEMFPRSVQPALEAWSKGELSEAEFLEQSRWHEVWGFHPALYLPLFHFARQTRSPTVALNVERDLVARVGQEGWQAIPADQREGVSDPAPADPAYRESLAEVYLLAHGNNDEVDSVENIEGDDFAHFVEAQLTWDRAMAEALAAAAQAHPEALIVGIIGQGHLEHGYGVPHQLADLGMTDVAVLLPRDPTAVCALASAEIADGIFVVDPLPPASDMPDKPKLGVFLEGAEGGLRILRVAEGGVAEAADLRSGDIITAAAGAPLKDVGDLVTVIGRQAPGTWLPLEVQRDGALLEVVAKFPPNLVPAP